MFEYLRKDSFCDLIRMVQFKVFPVRAPSQEISVVTRLNFEFKCRSFKCATSNALNRLPKNADLYFFLGLDALFFSAEDWL